MDADRSKERAAQQHLLRSLGWSGVDPEAPLPPTVFEKPLAAEEEDARA